MKITTYSATNLDDEYKALKEKVLSEIEKNEKKGYGSVNPLVYIELMKVNRLDALYQIIKEESTIYIEKNTEEGQ